MTSKWHKVHSGHGGNGTGRVGDIPTKFEENEMDILALELIEVEEMTYVAL